MNNINDTHTNMYILTLVCVHKMLANKLLTSFCQKLEAYTKLNAALGDKGGPEGAGNKAGQGGWTREQLTKYLCSQPGWKKWKRRRKEILHTTLLTGQKK